ncbi:MAG: hypothetical protein R6V58_14700 [Planctomycetota bacterium]
MAIHAGAASNVINPEVGAFIQGAGVDNRAERIRDDLEANALYLTNGSTAGLLVSCDLVGLDPAYVATARDAIGEAAGIAPRNVILAGTHTHSGPSVVRSNYLKPVDTDYLDRLRGWLVELATEAVGSARPAQIGWGLGDVRIGYNRRCCWSDGSHTMHRRPGHGEFTGLEGPDDTRHLGLFVRDADGERIAVLYNNTSHPTCFYGADFFSADFPGAARAYLREALGDIPVLFFNGAFGDMAGVTMQTPRPRGESREQRLVRTAHLAAGETLRLLHEARFVDDAPLDHRHEDLSVTVRLPRPERVRWARSILSRVGGDDEPDGWQRMLAYGVTLLQDEYADNPAETLPVHAVRIGDVALLTQPCELYCQFGLDIKRRSPAPLTAVCGIADGYAGYCPTAYGVLGGGYSGEPFHWCRLELLAGYRIVDAAAKLLHELWD